jgi:1-pyrroline-5-carboxylate dehydrogenase
MFARFPRNTLYAFNPKSGNGTTPVTLQNFLDGDWSDTRAHTVIVDPLNGDDLVRMPKTSKEELVPFIKRMHSIPKTGLHNPLKNVDRYLKYGDLSFKLAAALGRPETEEHFALCIQRVVPKSYVQCLAEVRVVREFLRNFGGDQVRFLARGFTVPGDYVGQQSQGYRFPYGSCVIVSPFNFPLEIPVLQLMGALFMGNHVTLKPASTVSMVMEEWLRLMLECGMPPGDVNLIHCSGEVAGELIERGLPRMTQFTGSSDIAEHLTAVTRGKIRIEDAGFDWKILGPDFHQGALDYVAWTCDQDAYANTGQKCSAQSMLFMHANWSKAGLMDRVKRIAAERSLDNLTIAPVLSHTTGEILTHVDQLLRIPGSSLLFGGTELKNHTIPKKYGAVHPTAVFVPLNEFFANFDLVTREIFGPFQVVTEYATEQLPLVLEVCERISHHLTAAVVSKDPEFINTVLGSTVNGTTYTGIRARTTGAPQNHWFGPAGDPRAAGIGSPEAIQAVWSCHREIIHDTILPNGWTRPKPT